MTKDSRSNAPGPDEDTTTGSPPQSATSGLPEQRETRGTPPEDGPSVETVENADATAVDAADDEVERLRQQVADLQRQVTDTQPVPPLASAATGPRRGRWRPWVAGAMIAVAALIAPLAIVATWAHDQISDTDRYVEAVGPLGADPAVQDAIVDRITTEIFARLDIQAVTQEAVDALAAQGLPPRVVDSLEALATPIAGGIRNFVTERVSRIIKSQEFEDAWVSANREAHTQMVAVLTGEGSETVDVTGNTVSVNLAVVIRTVKAQLEEAGFALASRIPEVNAQFTIFQSEDLSKAQTAFDLLDRIARALPVIGLLLLAGAVYLARDRRRALFAAGLAIAGSMLLLGATLNAFRPIYLDAIPADQLPQDAAASIYDTLVQFIRLNLRAVAVVALAVAAGAWLSGSSAAAVGTRRGLARVVGAVRGGGERVGINTGPVGVFAHTYRTALRALIIGVAVIVYVQAEHPTGASTLKILGITVALLLLLELIARPQLVEKDRTADAVTAGHVAT